jgi:hypothetical protein
MRNALSTLACAALVAGATLLAPATPAFAQSAPQVQQVKLTKGSWSGKVGDSVELEIKEGALPKKVAGTVQKIDTAKGIITLQVTTGGRTVTRPVFVSDILSMKTVGAAAPASGGPSKPATGGSSSQAPAGQPAKPASGAKVDSQGFELDENGYRVSPKKGVFVLPWKGGVGQTARAYEIEQVGKEADKWGPGQTIIMEIDSPGGLVTEIFKIVEAIKSVRERHRVVAWIREAISAAAVTSMNCDEIYFRKMGALGAAMMIRGRDSVYGDALDAFRSEIGVVVARNGRPAMVFEAMVLAKAVLTYTKDPVTGKVTWHDRITGEPGEVVLSDEKDNLTFNASNALDSGFSKGTADTNEEMAQLLGLKEWYEVSDYGRRIAKNWQDLFEGCEKDLELQIGRLNIPRAGTPAENLAANIQIVEKILAWCKKCKPCTDGKGIDPEAIEKQLKDMRKQLGELRKAEQKTGG